MTTLIELELERVAHGGFVVGRHEGKVCFTTGGLPGELVRVEITETGKRFDRGRVVEVVRAAPGRVEPPCPIAGRCGGCDWQHADAQLQLDLKTAVVAEQLQRLAGLEWDGRVQAVHPTTGWRTRMRYSVGQGGVGLRAMRSHHVVPLPPETGCLIAAPGGPDPAGLNELGAGAESVSVVTSDDGVTLLVDGRVLSGAAVVHQRVGGREFEVGAGGFWQVHPQAATVLTDAVLRLAQPQPGERALDLYCGVGLFAGALVDAGCDVLGVELSVPAVKHARRNVPEAEFRAAPMARALAGLPRSCDIVVLDPPRTGAGADVVDRLASLGARAIVYVACDPAALGRDLALFADRGYVATALEAYDLFPMTHHVECVALLSRGGTGHASGRR